MGDTQPCQKCQNPVSLSAERCPHCAWPGLFPNVRTAEAAAERKAVDERYQQAMAACTARGCNEVAKGLERALAGSEVVIARSLAECQRLANSDRQGYATYYQLIESESRVPDGDEWDPLRRVVDEALFPGYKEKIRFGALSLNGIGIQRYGDCSLMLRPELIEFRSTVFTENSVLHMKRHNVPLAAIPNRVVGHRAPWADRARLAVAKLSDKLDKATPGSDFPGLLLKQGAGPEDDDFVEVHIWGPVSIRTVKRVTFTGARKTMSKAIAKALRERLDAHGVELRG